MTPEQFVQDLDRDVSAALDGIGSASAAAQPGPAMSVVALLKLALKNELEAAEEAAIWLASERDVHVKLALARQCGDEAKHYRLIEARLRELGADTGGFDPLAQGYSPIFDYLRSLETTAERLAAGPFAREALAKTRNEVFIEWCERQGDLDTARLYREVVQPDEAYHHELGRRLLPRFVQGEADQARARKAARHVLSLAEELQEVARLKGLCRLPGC
ncbi:MAG: ferritin-like domain-containing protein [Polyangiaceae bacterium]